MRCRSKRPHRKKHRASGNCTALKRAAERGAVGNRVAVSIALGRTSLMPVQTKSLRSQPLYLVIECVHFLCASRGPGFRRIGGAQFFQRFLDREFRCFGHGKPLIQARCVRPCGNSYGRGLPSELTRRLQAILGDREACSQYFRYFSASVDLDQQERLRHEQRSFRMVHWRSADIHLRHIRYDALYGYTRISRTSVIKTVRFRKNERCRVPVWATKWARHATRLLQLFRCVSGDSFLRVSQRDSTEPYAISL